MVKPATTSTELAFGIPSFLLPNNNNEDDNNNETTTAAGKKNAYKKSGQGIKKADPEVVDNKNNSNKNKITAKGILQLITAGAGAPTSGALWIASSTTRSSGGC